MKNNNENLHINNVSSKREKVALVLLSILVIAGIFVITRYLSTSTSFTIAATRVDETVGNLDHYSAIIYSGIIKDEEKESIANKNQVYKNDIYKHYIDKQAYVSSIDLNDFSLSEQSRIVTVGNKKVGIFSILSYRTATSLNSYINYFKSKGTDVIICVAPRSNMVGSFDGIDTILCTKEKSPSEKSEGYENKTLIARSPFVGEVGILTISSSNVVSQRVISCIDDLK